MAADQPPSRGPGRPRTRQNAGTVRGELAGWLQAVADRGDPKISNGAIAARAGVTPAAVGRAMRGETFASADIVAAVVELGDVTERERQDYAEWVAELAEREALHGRETAAIPPPWSQPHEDTQIAETQSVETDQRCRRRRATMLVAGLVVLVVVTIVVVVVVAPRPGPVPVPMNRVEQVANHLGTPTFADPVHGSGATGPRIPALQLVEVSCKVYAPIFASVLPDGYWYRIESAPWNGHFYAVANTFANGDLPGAVPATNTDRSVPDC